MSVCALRIPADTGHVRVARLVATAAARRCGLGEQDVDDVRLAVGEAVGLAVLRQQKVDSMAPVTVRICDDETLFSVEVHDGAPPDGDGSGLAMAIISGLVPAARTAADPGGGQVLRLAWSLPDSQDL